MSSSLKLIATTPAMVGLLAGALAEYGVACQTHGKMVSIDANDANEVVPERVIAMLRDVLTAPEREAVSVVEEMDFPGEFPVTTRLEAWWSVFETAWFEKAVAADSFSVWFQPIVDTTARRILGHECLLRLTTGRRREGAEIMAAAAARHDLREFDSYTRQLAISAISAQPGNGGMCFVNFVPSAIYRPSWCMRETMQLLKETGLPPASIVMEAVQTGRDTGRATGNDIPHLKRIADYFHEQGLGFALDDVGANAEALRLICELRPDYIKLESSLVRGIDRLRNETAVRKLVEVAGRFNVGVIAKGVESVSTMERLWAVGVECMQGYLFGSPSPDMGETSLDLVHLARAIPPSAQPDGVGNAAMTVAWIP